ncbi:MAG: hypothetical protein MUF54_15075 [Polyangiaceae bacterium]|jgi:transketolase|nr:hypothetical protein [Polyangiaceae bacterium]
MLREMVARPHRNGFPRWARDKRQVLVLSADLTSSCEADLFRQAYPDRFFSMGMAEQNMMGFAGGLAREGFYPFVHTFAVFITRRAFDQVAMSIAYPNLPVRLLGFLPGLTTPGGVTHQAIDDIALMRAVPNMTVLACGDATDVESVLDVAQSVPGPVYVRMLRGEVPRLFPASEHMRLGVPRLLGHGDDVTIFTSGICTEQGMMAAQALRAHGLGITHLHVSTIKPLEAATVVDACEHTRCGVVVLENHSVVGGLGSAVAEVLAERGLGKRLVRLGVRDVYAHGASRPYLLRGYGLDAVALVRAVEELVGEGPLGIDENSLLRAPERVTKPAEAEEGRVEDL